MNDLFSRDCLEIKRTPKPLLINKNIINNEAISYESLGLFIYLKARQFDIVTAEKVAKERIESEQFIQLLLDELFENKLISSIEGGYYAG